MKELHIQYVEFASKDLAKTKVFFTEVFGWRFVDYGDTYTAFSDHGIDGGFYKADKFSSTKNGGALVVFYTQHLQKIQVKIEQAGGTIVKPIFFFPGGRRFHFCGPCGNEMAVWSDM